MFGTPLITESHYVYLAFHTCCTIITRDQCFFSDIDQSQPRMSYPESLLFQGDGDKSIVIIKLVESLGID